MNALSVLNPVTWGLGQWVLAIVGLAHALASFFYFAKSGRALPWALLWTGVTLVSVAALPRDPTLVSTLFAGIVGLWTVWWMSLRPSLNRPWVRDNRYQARGIINGDTLTIDKVRNFLWIDRRDVTERWEERHYDLTRLDGLDVILCHFAGRHIAHTLVSFTFADGPALCFSIETRREENERWSSLSGFFKAYELLLLAGDERDFVRVRMLRGEDLRLYRLYSTKDARRRILEQYVGEMNRLAEHPRFYQTIWANCTMEVAAITTAAGEKRGMSWELLLSGYVPRYLYRRGLLDTRHSLDDLARKAKIADRVREAGIAANFSQRIREGVPAPLVEETTY